MDLIDRQAAIKTLEKGLPSEPLKSKYTEGITVGFGLAITWIEQLPAVQPEPKPDENGSEPFGNAEMLGDRTTDDCISRQAVLKSIDDYERLSAVSQTVRNMTSLREIVQQLPSAQPEIIRCKDCRWHNGEINQCNAQICASMYGEDFCSKGERREE